MKHTAHVNGSAVEGSHAHLGDFTTAMCVVRRESVTEQERQKAEDLIGRLETTVGQIFPRDGGNAWLIASAIQDLNGLRSLLGIVRPH